MDYSTLRHETYLQALKNTLNQAESDQELFKTIVDAPFDSRLDAALLFLGIVVLLLVNEDTQSIDRIALSNTELATRTLDVTQVPFKDIRIPLSSKVNTIAMAIRERKSQSTTDWRTLFHPAMDAVDARINQANSGVAYSVVYPLHARSGGALIYSFYQYPQFIGDPHKSFMESYTRLVEAKLQK